MILTRTPLRLSLGGGPTDLPSYADTHGGFCVTAAITRYVYVAALPSFDGDVFCRYRETERVRHPQELQHPFLRAALSEADVGPLEIVSLADVPAGTGLGSSGAFAVGLLHLLAAQQGKRTTPTMLAEDAARLEIEACGRAVGRQDHYACAFGGLQTLTFPVDDRVQVAPLRVSPATLEHLERNLHLFFLSAGRDAERALAAERHTDRVNLDAVKALGIASAAALEAGDVAGFADLLAEHWTLKCHRSPVPDRIAYLVSEGRRAGARAGKLVGAGGGGCLLFYAEDAATLTDRMQAEGLRHIPFRFEMGGSRVLVTDG